MDNFNNFGGGQQGGSKKTMIIMVIIFFVVCLCCVSMSCCSSALLGGSTYIYLYNYDVKDITSTSSDPDPIAEAATVACTQITACGFSVCKRGTITATYSYATTGTASTAESATECAKRCNGLFDCKSLQYDVSSKMCSMFAQDLQGTSDTSKSAFESNPVNLPVYYMYPTACGLSTSVIAAKKAYASESDVCSTFLSSSTAAKFKECRTDVFATLTGCNTTDHADPNCSLLVDSVDKATLQDCADWCVSQQPSCTAFMYYKLNNGSNKYKCDLGKRYGWSGGQVLSYRTEKDKGNPHIFTASVSTAQPQGG